MTEHDASKIHSPPDDTPGDKDPSHQPILDFKDLILMGRECQVCPFYLSRSWAKRAKLIFAPYNYLLDGETRRRILHLSSSTNEGVGAATIQSSFNPSSSSLLSLSLLQGAVVIFDEDHNLESLALDAASFDLSVSDLVGCIHYMRLMHLPQCVVGMDLLWDMGVVVVEE